MHHARVYLGAGQVYGKGGFFWAVMGSKPPIFQKFLKNRRKNGRFGAKIRRESPLFWTEPRPPFWGTEPPLFQNPKSAYALVLKLSLELIVINYYYFIYFLFIYFQLFLFLILLFFIFLFFYSTFIYLLLFFFLGGVGKWPDKIMIYLSIIIRNIQFEITLQTG